MAGKDKNTRTTLSGFLRYRGNKMTGQERNSFERELQKDPFSAEAMEGFDELTPEQSGSDLRHLNKLLKTRAAGKSRLMFYRVAASVAVLMIISSLFIVLQLNKTEKTVSENKVIEIPFEKPVSPSLSEKIEKKDDYIALNRVSDSSPIKKEPIIAMDAALSSEKVSKKQKETVTEAAKAQEIISEPEKIEAEMIRPVAAPARALGNVADTKEAAKGGHNIRGRIISSEDNMPIPGATVSVKGTTIGTVTDTDGNFSLSLPDITKRSLVANFIGMESKEFSLRQDSFINISMEPASLALDEVIVAGYGVERKSAMDKEDAMSATYFPPEPMGGKAEFDKYIKNNLRMPAAAKSGDREVVVINFKVAASGIIENIKIIRSPGKAFSDEAIRLIKEGPEWKPAEENRIRIDDEVRIRIVFREY